METPLVATFGISLILQAMFAGAWTTDAKAIPASYAATGVTIADVRVRTVYVIAFVLAVAFVLLLVTFRSLVVPLTAIVETLQPEAAAIHSLKS